MDADRSRVLAIVGPTAAGKSEAAVAAAEAVGGVVLSADAMQVYRGMDIGTAKVGAAERLRVPHRGLDVVDPDEAFDAADFLALADATLAEGRPVIVAGGTHQYVHLLRRGLVATPPTDPDLRGRLEALADPHQALAAVDPALAARLDPADRLRCVRGLEVHHLTGRRLSDLQAEHARLPDRVEVEGLFLDRADLDARIDARARAMFDAGYVAEVEGLLARGYGRGLKPMRSLGYRHVASHLLDGLALEEALRATQRDSRRFARKQRTWNNALALPVVTEDHVQAALRAASRVFDGQSG